MYSDRAHGDPHGYATLGPRGPIYPQTYTHGYVYTDT